MLIRRLCAWNLHAWNTIYGSYSVFFHSLTNLVPGHGREKRHAAAFHSMPNHSKLTKSTDTVLNRANS